MQGAPTSDLARTGVVVGGKYRLDVLIGRGGMGSVWSATHLSLGHQVAIKLISRDFVRSPAALRRFDAEAKAVARLQSRHVVQVYDNGTLEDGTPFITMELLAGESLQQRIDRAGPLPLAEAVRLLAQCCKALTRAHALGIIHRDIKPDNIFLARSPDEDLDVAKVLDFGVAKVTLDSGSGDQSATKTGAVLGTPLYMSPEQARGLKSVDARSDLYSLGLVFYTMLTGRDAFEGEAFGDILLKICVEPLPRLSAHAFVRPAVDQWFERACARNPDDRWRSAQEFAETLRAASGEPSTISRPDGPLAIAPTASDAEPVRPFATVSGQSVADANVAITAAGVPRRPVGAIVAAAMLLALLAAGGAVLFVLAPGSSRGGTSVEATHAAAKELPARVTPPAPTIALSARQDPRFDGTNRGMSDAGAPGLKAGSPIAQPGRSPSATAVPSQASVNAMPASSPAVSLAPPSQPTANDIPRPPPRVTPSQPKIDLGY